MRELNKKIMEETHKSKLMGELLQKCDNFEQGKKIREEQKKHYDKFVFFKNLGKALEKERSK